MVWFRKLFAATGMMIFIIILPSAAASQVQSTPRISISKEPGAKSKLGDNYIVSMNREFFRVELVPSFDRADLETRCENLRNFLDQGLLDRSNLGTVLAPNPKPRLKITFLPFQTEYELVWKAALDAFIQSQSIPFAGSSAPYRPSILDLSLNLIADDLDGADALEFERVEAELNKEMVALTPEMQANGFVYYDISSALFPCIILNNGVRMEVKLEARSFDRVASTRLLTERQLRDVVRGTEAQVQKDNNPSGYVNSDNIEQFIFFRSVEAIGRTFTWLEKEKVLVWQRFVRNWTSRLSGQVRALSEEELFAAGEILTSRSFSPTLLTLSERGINVTVSEK